MKVEFQIFPIKVYRNKMLLLYTLEVLVLICDRSSDDLWIPRLDGIFFSGSQQICDQRAPSYCVRRRGKSFYHGTASRSPGQFSINVHMRKFIRTNFFNEQSAMYYILEAIEF